MWSCQLWLYLLLSYEIGRVIRLFSCSTVWHVYHFRGYCSHGFRLLSMYFPIDYYHFRNYWNIGALFVSDDNIISISILRKKNVKIKAICPRSDYFQSFSSQTGSIIGHTCWHACMHVHGMGMVSRLLLLACTYCTVPLRRHGTSTRACSSLATTSS
jgi:hypothetical protein